MHSYLVFIVLVIAVGLVVTLVAVFHGIRHDLRHRGLHKAIERRRRLDEQERRTAADQVPADAASKRRW